MGERLTKAAAPKYCVGQRVSYVDRHERLQSGEVYRIEASWMSYGGPLIIYTVGHPTYRGKRHYAGELAILAALQPKDTENG